MGDRLYQKKPGGTWYGVFYDSQGRRHQRCTKCRDRRAARNALHEFERAARSPEGLSKEEVPTATLMDVLTSFIARSERKKRAEGTINCYVTKCGHLLRVLGEYVDVNALPNNVEEAYVRQRQAEDAHDHTIHKELVVLRATLKLAKRNGLLHGDLDRLRTDHSPNYQPRRRFLTVSEYKSLLAALPAHRRSTAAFIVLTSARDSEWPSVERVHADFDSVLTLPGTKTRRAWRQVPLREHADLAHLLRQVLDALPEKQQRLFEPWLNIRRDLHTACARARIPHVSPNDLRRTFASWCWQGGMHPSRIALLLGHRDARMVERVYGVLDAGSLGGDVATVFNRLDLPSVSVPKAGSKWVTNNGQKLRQKRQVRRPTLSASEEIQQVQMPRGGIEPPTRGFSVLCST